MPVLVINQRVTFCVFLKTCYRQNSCGLYIIEKYGEKIEKEKDRMMSDGMLSRWKVIYQDDFFIMIMYREKGIIFDWGKATTLFPDYLKRSLAIRHSSIIYT